MKNRINYNHPYKGPGPDDGQLVLQTAGNLNSLGALFVGVRDLSNVAATTDPEGLALASSGHSLYTHTIDEVSALTRTESIGASPARVLALRRMKGPSDPRMPLDPLWAAATFVVDVVGRAGWIVAGVNGQHGIGLVAESIVRLLYDFFYVFITALFSGSYNGGGGGSRTRVRKCYWSRELHA